MSRIWNGSIACAAKGSTAPAKITQEATGRIRLGMSEDIRSLLRAQMADHVVGKGESHQQQEYQSPAALQPDLPQLGDRATGRTLEQIIQQHPPIEHGDGQQVQHAETDADHREKA